MSSKFSWVFRWRGYLIVPYGIVLLALGRPTVFSYFFGLGWIFLGEALRIWGVGFIGKVSRRATVEAPVLLTAGPFAYLRHPLYLGNSLVGLGGFFIAAGNASRLTVLLLLACCLFFYGIVYGILMQLEEGFLEEKFGESYREYKRHVSRFIPGTKPYSNPQGTFHWSTAWSSESYTLIPLFLVLLLVWFLIRIR